MNARPIHFFLTIALIPIALMVSGFQPVRYITVRHAEAAFSDQQIAVTEEAGRLYIPLDIFSEKTGYGIYTNEQKQKCVLYIEDEKATFTADNPFVILNERVWQLPWQPRWREGTMQVPVALLESLFGENNTVRLRFDREKNLLTVSKAENVNITDVAITPKENGTVISVRVTDEFEKRDISTKITNGWFHIEIHGGKAVESLAERITPRGIISKVEVIPLEGVVSLAFRLKKRIIDRDITLDPDKRYIYVSLRTNEKVAVETRNEAALEKQKREWLIDTIVIDPGHGGKDPGAIGKGGVREKDIVLGVGLKLGAIIKRNFPDIKVVYTRDRDVFIPLRKRTQLANENRGKIFISLHCNSNPNHKARGFETYFLGADQDKNEQARNTVLKENASIQFEDASERERYKGVNFILATMAQSAFIRQSQYLATTVQSSMAQGMKPIGLHSRGVKQGRFWVMVGATMPNILIEMGFVSNPYEAGMLKKSATQMKIAQSIFEGIKKYKKDIEAAI